MNTALDKERKMNMNDGLFLVSARHPSLDLSSSTFVNYIATNEEFKKFTSEVFDLTEDNSSNALFAAYVKMFQRVHFVSESSCEMESAIGIERIMSSQQGDVKVGYTKTKEDRIYVECNGKYLRGVKGWWKDLCLVNAMDFIPLDKSLGDGNIEILLWNKRKATKGIRFIHNKIKSVLYVVDTEFDTEDEMERDMENPEEINLGLLLGSLLK